MLEELIADFGIPEPSCLKDYTEGVFDQSNKFIYNKERKHVYHLEYQCHGSINYLDLANQFGVNGDREILLLKGTDPENHTYQRTLAKTKYDLIILYSDFWPELVDYASENVGDTGYVIMITKAEVPTKFPISIGPGISLTPVPSTKNKITLIIGKRGSGKSTKAVEMATRTNALIYEGGVPHLASLLFCTDTRKSKIQHNRFSIPGVAIVADIFFYRDEVLKALGPDRKGIRNLTLLKNLMTKICHYPGGLIFISNEDEYPDYYDEIIFCKRSDWDVEPKEAPFRGSR